MIGAIFSTVWLYVLLTAGTIMYVKCTKGGKELVAPNWHTNLMKNNPYLGWATAFFAVAQAFIETKKPW